MIRKPSKRTRSHIFVLMKSLSRRNLCHVRSKSRSLGQIIRRFSKHSRSQIYSPNFMKTGQYNCLYKISVKFKSGSLGVKSRSVGQIIRTPSKHSRSYNFSPKFMKTGQYDCLDETSVKIESLSHGVKKEVITSKYQKNM